MSAYWDTLENMAMSFETLSGLLSKIDQSISFSDCEIITKAIITAKKDINSVRDYFDGCAKLLEEFCK